MSDQDPVILKFLARVESDHGDDLRARCVEVLRALPAGTPFNPFYVLTQAKLRLQETHLQDLASMNATAFHSARVRETDRARE